MRFCEASAKDNFNVDEIFLKLVDDILSKVGVSFTINISHVFIFNIKNTTSTDIFSLGFLDLVFK